MVIADFHPLFSGLFKASMVVCFAWGAFVLTRKNPSRILINAGPVIGGAILITGIASFITGYL